MKAYLLKEAGKFVYSDVEEPQCGENGVIVSVAAAGVCGSDISRVYGTGAYSYPLIPGHEFSGVVTQVGKNTDRSWLGKRAGIYPLLPCGKCAPCKDRHYELCRGYGYLGSRTAGGFAEYVAVPEWNLIELPENISFEQAAMLEPVAVAAHAMRSAGVTKGRTIAICGAGTIGLLLHMLLKEQGADRICLIGNRYYQREIAVRTGADTRHFCNSRMVNADRWLDETAGDGADIFFDCAGTEESVGLALRHTAPGGMVVLVGNPASDMAFDRQTYWKILRNQLTIKGIWNSSFTHEDTDDWHYCMDLITRKRIMPDKLISHVFPLERLSEGMELMRDKRDGCMKIMAVRQACVKRTDSNGNASEWRPS